MTHPRLEVIASTLEDAIAAEQGGADSVEVCIDLVHDGLTPPLVLVKAIRKAVKIDMNVMIRPHSRNFVYDTADVMQMLVDIEAFKPLGIQTLVFGAHTSEGRLDIDLIKRIAQAAHPVKLTLHRALDTCTNPDEALHALTGVVHRVLTSGPAPNAWEGRDGLRKWVNTFGTHYRFAAGGGIRLENAREIMQHTGAHECHVGSAAQTNGTPQSAVDVDKVRALVKVLHS